MREIIDLTMTLEHGQPGVEFESSHTVEKNGWNARTLHLYSHTGTHMDAPFHFGVSSQTIEEIPLSRLLVRGTVVSIDNCEPGQILTVDSPGSQLDKVKPSEAVLIKTNWSRHFGNEEIYRHGLPRIGEELARYFVQKKVGIVGVEPPSVADVNNLEEVTLIHQILLGGDIIIVEGLTNLDKLSGKDFLFGAMPLKIGGGDGTPCRAFAMIENESSST